MKLNSLFSLLATLTLAACGSAVNSNSSTKADHGTTNDLPNPILKCVETQDGAVVADGRVEVTVGKDQFAQLSAEVVQKDQFSGNSVLGLFLGVEEFNSASVLGGVVQNPPDVMYIGNNAGKHMTLSLWKDTTKPNKSIASLTLKVDAPYSERSLTLECRKP